MVLIAALIGAALETSEMHRPSRNALVRRDNSHDDHLDSQHEISQDQIDERAFQEVQKYADFQRELSERVYDDILKEGTYGYPRSSLDTSVFPSICHNFLPAPIIIPQQRSEGGKRAWTRAYAPSLLGCGIDQDTFLDFLDSYNQVTKNSPYLGVVNLPALWARPTPSMTQTSVSRAIPMAVSLAKTLQSEEQSNYLRHANDELFVLHGLFALVVTFNHSRNSQTYTVDISQPSSTGSTTHTIQPQQQTGAPLIFPEVDTDCFMQRIKAEEMDEDILYLMIVNN
ncbi:hypothetical protein M430DRAFT_20504 [Amorphotheca resinae ATCC 22711]|uniref:Uncharacterized protein n=1 Tax=Amorphotheca resinae ATCC 22711 TaxID=857342 RepID=A0A2T3AYQ8_AMORE|nr:hypothetical protein M430DRAFT_20504 [Amorphotheca resinae ATCC 22711]PSS15198.1 hypothetical protein M430DRAFT_20504 [Amorphotheca resinae ATCC 22711]